MTIGSQPSATPVLDLLAAMTAKSLEASTLDPTTLMLTRIAALVAVDAPPASYIANLGVAADLEIDPEDVQGVLTAIAPIVGTARVVAASARIVKAIGLALEMIDLDDLEEIDGG
jgi:hypothetical protein